MNQLSLALTNPLSLKSFFQFFCQAFPVGLILIILALLSSTVTTANSMLKEFEDQLRAADQAGVTGPEIEQLREMLKVLKADEAATRAYEMEQARAAREEAIKNQSAGASVGRLPADAPGTLQFYTRDGALQTLKVDRSQLERYAGSYLNEYRDPALADFRYTLNANGTARLEYRACENCTHELDGSLTSRDWQIQYESVSWAPLLTEEGEPMERTILDLYDKPHRARVLVVTLKEGGVMSLNHYLDGNRAALGGPYGVPRFRQNN